MCFPFTYEMSWVISGTEFSQLLKNVPTYSSRTFVKEKNLTMKSQFPDIYYTDLCVCNRPYFLIEASVAKVSIHYTYRLVVCATMKKETTDILSRKLVC